MLLSGVVRLWAQEPGALLSGHVADRTGRNVDGAEVVARCGSEQRRSTTDAEGDFQLRCAQWASPVDVRVRASGFTVVTLPASVGVPLAVTLVPSVASEQVTVTATRTSLPVGATAKTAYTLSAGDLADYPAPTLDDALRQHAGFELFRRASSRVSNPTTQGISLRGLGSTAVSRTLVLEDGAPLNDPFGGWVHWNETPAQTVEAVTIVTGGGSDLYGSSALGGVVDVLPAAGERSLFAASAAGGSQATSTYEARGDRILHGFSMSGAGESLRSGGYVLVSPDAAGPVDVAANVHSQSLHTEFGRRGAATKRVFLTGNMFNEARGNGTPLQKNATRLWRYLGGYDTPAIAAIAGRVRVFGSDEGYRQTFSAISPGRGAETLSRVQRVRAQELGATADASAHFGRFAVVAGADTRDIRGRDDETPYSKGSATGLQAVSARQRYTGGFAEVLGEAGPWSAAASVRVDLASNFSARQVVQTQNTYTATSPADRTETVVSPRLGLERHLPGGVSIHASAARAFRSPTLNELYRTGQVGQEITLASNALQSERATGVEGGGQWSRGLTSLQATYFWTEINRPVSAVLVSQTVATLTNQRQNLGQIVSQGIELSAEILRGHALSGSVGYQFADASVRSFSATPALVGKRIPQVPQHSATAQFHARNARLGQITLAARASGMAFDDSANTFVLRRFFILDLAAQRRVGHGLEVFGLIQNLTGQRADVARTPVLTLGSPVFAEAGVRLRLGASTH